MENIRLEQIKQDYRDGKQQQFIGFWGNQNDTPEEVTFSNFQECYFDYDVNLDTPLRSVNKVRFSSSEQFFMYKKAVHFKDFDSASRMLESGYKPYHYKKLGRQVKNYNDEEWAKVRYNYMLEALRLKYGKNKELKNILLNTGDAILVEASPFDRVWGVGLAKFSKRGESQPEWKNPLKWQGDNLLGLALMQVREEFNEMGGNLNEEDI